ncbi:MAG TPA: carboxypeptidase-like regulatory domain-containing protein [Candidatus Angelobacter sp.]
MARKLGCLLLVLFATSTLFAANSGTISGYVKDSSGMPQMGAVVEIFTSVTTLGATVFTDERGFYSAANLLPGIYQVKVTALSFLPSLRENVTLRSGARVLVNVTVNALADSRRLLPAWRSASTDADDWHWTLRSSVNRPILRWQDDKDSNPEISAGEKPADRSLKAQVAFIAGSDAGGFGSAGDMTTAFTLQKSLFSDGVLSFNGNIGASSGDPAGVVQASYTHDFGPASRPKFTVTYRRFAAPGTDVPNSPYAAVEMNSSDSMTVGDLVELQYGAAVQSLEFTRRVTAFHPYGAIMLHLSPDLVVAYRYTTFEPNTRAAKGFDSAPADLSESGPKMALVNGEPDLERAQHQEVSASRRFGKTSVQVACYLDRIRNVVLTGAGDPSAYSDDVLPDVYSGTFSYAYNGVLNTTGARVVVERRLLDDLTATMDYSAGEAIGEDSAANWQNLARALAASRQQSVAAKFSGSISRYGTRWMASYKWTSGNTLSPVDAFNASPGQADPYLSVFIRQPLPGAAGRMDVLLDLRNLLAQGYLPVMGPDGRTVYMVQSARSLRAGLAFTF